MLLLTVWAVSLRAQTGTSTITGTVRDPLGAAIPDASVKVISENSGVSFPTQSNEAGLYRVASLAPGVYRVEAKADGFESLLRSKLVLEVGQVLAVDLHLGVGAHSEAVTITESAPMAESQSSNIGQVINRKMVAGLPMPNRAATSLAALAPGVVMVDTGQGAENYPVFSVAGGRVRNQHFTLDGGNVTNAVGLTRPQQLTSLPMDAMQEFQVIGNNYAAEHGHSTGGVITLSTRSGANEFHGSLFEYARNDALDARNFFAARKAPLRMHQFGATLGGPIRKDKTHFFATWEQMRQLTSQTVLQTVPGDHQRAGDFSRLSDAAGNLIPIYDPATTVGRYRQPFPDNRIPGERFDPVARAALAFWPLPNRPATATGSSNFVANSDSRLHRDIIVGRLDHQFRPSDQFTLRYYINDSSIDNRGSFDRPEAAPDSNKTDARIQSILASHTHVFRPTLINELRVSYLRRKFIDQRYGMNENLAGSLGLSGVSDAAFPAFTLPGYASMGGSISRIQTPIEDTQLLEAVSVYRGKHAWKLGVEYRRGFNNEIRDRASSGNFSFTPLITSKPGTPGAGNSLASFLLGEVNAASIFVSDKIPSRAYYWAGYAQDDWRITDRLTLNYGLRWETELPRRVDGDRMNSFDPVAINPVSGTPGVVTFAGRNRVPRQAFNTDYNNLGPRLGFAWRPPALGNMVIRGGAGVFYASTVSNSIGDAAASGFSTSSSLVVSQADLLSAMRLRDGYPAFKRPPLGAGFGAVPLGKRPNTAVGFFERERPTPISYQYNLDIQRELVTGLLVEAGYMGNVSHHLTANDLTISQVPVNRMGPGDAQARRPFPQFSNVFLINPAVGNSTYHAGFLKAEKRFGRRVSFLAHYTFSKFIDDVASGNEYGDPASYMSAYDRRLDKSLSGTDVPHRAVLSGLYEVGSLKGNRFLAATIGGWRLGALALLQSGPPFTVVTAANTTNAFPAGPLRPDLVGDPFLASGERALSRWFNTAAFQQPAAFRFGNAPRSLLRGAPLQTVDVTLEKRFSFRERYHVDLRSELYNLLNHANFDIPSHTFGASDFGVVSSARPARTVQIGLRLGF